MTLLLVFVAVEQRAASPLLPLPLVTVRDRGGAYLAVFLLGTGLFAGFFLLTFYLQDARGFSPMSTGLAFLPFGLSAWLGSRSLAALRRRTSARAVLVTGLLATAAGLGFLTRLEPDSSYAAGVLPTFVLLGAGATAVMVTASDVATTGAGTRRGVGGAIVGGSQQTGAALGTALLSSIASSATAAYQRSRDLTAGSVEALVHGYGRAAAVGAVVIGTGAIAALVLLRGSTSPAVAAEGPLDRHQSVPSR